MTTPNPGAPLGMADFFVLEAGEYLERLDAQRQGREGTAPAPDEFVRLARALRGSALMASHQAIARAASGLEALARAVREARRPWDAATRQIAIRAVDDLKIFVRRATSWTEADTAKAEALGSQLEQLGGRPSAQIRAAEVLGLDAGARAFVAREGAAIASALDRAAQALRTNPLAHDPLQHVLRALQPLRGLAALSDLPPLPDLLEGIERTIGEFGRPGVPHGEAGELFQAAAGAIAKAARQVAERGRPDPEAPEFQAFAARLVRLEDAAPEVVPIASLYYADSGPHVVRRGTPRARPATVGGLELVSHGEHLRQAADSLERAPSATQRELRAHTLAGTFRALASAGGGPLADRVAEFARAAREALRAGLAVQTAVALAAELRKAGDLLARSASEDGEGLAAQPAEHTAAVQGLARSGAAPAAPVVPIESLAPTAATGPAPRLPVGDDAIPPETPDIVGSWVTYRRLVAAGVGPASTEALLGPGAAGPPVVDIRTLLYSGVRGHQRPPELPLEAKHAPAVAAGGDRVHGQQPAPGPGRRVRARLRRQPPAAGAVHDRARVDRRGARVRRPGDAGADGGGDRRPVVPGAHDPPRCAAVAPRRTDRGAVRRDVRRRLRRRAPAGALARPVRAGGARSVPASARGAPRRHSGGAGGGARGPEAARALRGGAVLVARAVAHQRRVVRRMLSGIRVAPAAGRIPAAPGHPGVRGGTAGVGRLLRGVREGGAADPADLRHQSEPGPGVRGRLPPVDVPADHAARPVLAVPSPAASARPPPGASRRHRGSRRSRVVTDAVRVAAHAKINLFLRILAREHGGGAVGGGGGGRAAPPAVGGAWPRRAP